MTAHELLTILSRLPHDAIITINNNGVYYGVEQVAVEMSTDLFEQRDHVILKTED
ncbi:MAG: hypothetical protein IKT93_05040 [Clostridia bacterium]|nr:hypothetical protein [Clostridia bacterium]